MSIDLKKYLNVYEFNTRLPGSGRSLKLRPLSTNDMKKMLVYENEDDELRQEDILDELINMSIIDDDVSIDDMYVLDRYFLFVEMRKVTKGKDYQFKRICDNEDCKGEIMDVVDLNELELKTKKNKTDHVDVANEQVRLYMEFPKRKEQKEAYKYVNSLLSKMSLSESKLKLQKQIEVSLANIATHVHEVGTEEGKEYPPFQTKYDFIGSLPASEYEKITGWIKDNEFGYSMTHKSKCPHCEKETERTIPLDNFFS